jgi:hypothetical protein
MAEKIRDYIQRPIDGTESKETLLHYRESFNTFVRNTSNAKSYNKDNNWKVFLIPALKPGSPPFELINIDDITQDYWWEEVHNMSESSRSNGSAVVSDIFAKMVRDAIRPGSVYHHQREFGDGVKLMFEKRVKLNSLNKFANHCDGLTPDQLNDLKKEITKEFKNALEIEFLHALGGPQVLGPAWNQNNSGKKLEDAGSLEIASFMNRESMTENIHYAIPPDWGETHVWKIRETDGKKDNWDGRKNSNNNNSNQQKIPTNNHNQQPKKKVKHVLLDKGTQQKPIVVDEKPGCQKCVKAGKPQKVALTHSTAEHKDDYGQAKRKVEQEPNNNNNNGGNKKQKVDQNQKK